MSPGRLQSIGGCAQLRAIDDADDGGVADGPGSALYTGLPSFITSVRRAGDLVFIAVGGPSIVILRQGASPADTLAYEGASTCTSWPRDHELLAAFGGAVVLRSRRVALANAAVHAEAEPVRRPR